MARVSPPNPLQFLDLIPPDLIRGRLPLAANALCGPGLKSRRLTQRPLHPQPSWQDLGLAISALGSDPKNRSWGDEGGGGKRWCAPVAGRA